LVVLPVAGGALHIFEGAAILQGGGELARVLCQISAVRVSMHLPQA
jgi:hypothetical protein